MKIGQRLWTENELCLALNLYAKLEFGKMHRLNPVIIELAGLINRTPSSVAFKLVNFASLDPELKKRGIKGASNTGMLDKVIWNRFYSNWDFEFQKSERLLAKAKKENIRDLYEEEITIANEQGISRRQWTNVRINQYRFRQMVLANYQCSCCITGLSQPDLLIASHITPWSKFENDRLNPANGLCINALHDKAFEKGLITISANDFKIRISSILKKQNTKEVAKYFLQYEGKQINLPNKFLPRRDFLSLHNEQFIV